MERNVWPYVAALVDGEGTISTGVHTLPDGKIRAVRLHLHINNSDFRLIKWLLKNLGGAFYQDTKIEGYSTPDSTRYKWYLGAQPKQKVFLESVLPYLMLKREQAEQGLEFLKAESTIERLSITQRIGELNSQFLDNRIFPILNGKNKFVYAAGIMDGEGTFCICRCGANGKKCWRADVSAANTDFQLIKWLLANFGGRFYSRKNGDSDKFIYSWRLSGGTNKEKLTLAVLPYLKIKREAANFVLQFLRLGSKKCPQEREKLAVSCSQFNNRIESPTTNTQDVKQTKIESELP